MLFGRTTLESSSVSVMIVSLGLSTDESLHNLVIAVLVAFPRGDPDSIDDNESVGTTDTRFGVSADRFVSTHRAVRVTTGVLDAIEVSRPEKSESGDSTSSTLEGGGAEFVAGLRTMHTGLGLGLSFKLSGGRTPAGEDLS